MHFLIPERYLDKDYTQKQSTHNYVGNAWWITARHCKLLHGFSTWTGNLLKLSGNSDTKVVFCHLNMLDAISHHRRCRKPSFTGYQPVMYRISQRGHTFSLFVICVVLLSTNRDNKLLFSLLWHPFWQVLTGSLSGASLGSGLCLNYMPKLKPKAKYSIWQSE